jgi:hypothetical protein
LMFKLAYTTDNFDRWRKYLGVMAWWNHTLCSIRQLHFVKEINSSLRISGSRYDMGGLPSSYESKKSSNRKHLFESCWMWVAEPWLIHTSSSMSELIPSHRQMTSILCSLSGKTGNLANF